MFLYLWQAICEQRLQMRGPPVRVTVECVITYMNEAKRRFCTKAIIQQQGSGPLLAEHYV